MHRHLPLAISVAAQSEGVGKRKAFRVGAVLYKSKTVYSARCNQLKTHPLLAPYTKWPFLHAESSCIIHHGIDHCSGLDLLGVRLTPSGKLTMAKPCPTCESFMQDAGIRNVYYSNQEGEVVRND